MHAAARGDELVEQTQAVRHARGAGQGQRNARGHIRVGVVGVTHAFTS